MNLENILSSLIRNPVAVLNSKNVFLISHMRGNTSLLSHLLGSHSMIEGYYEMHIGYYSWKSLIRQKIRYLNDHKLKTTSRFYFDKILHNDHAISDSVLKSKKSKVIIMIREPEQTIKSIVTLYKKNEPKHPYCNVIEAAEYYSSRLIYIKNLAKSIQGKYYLVQSELLKSEPEETLLTLGNWLELSSPISMKYKQFKNTGKAKYGDSSENIKTGEIINQSTDYSDILIEPELLNQLNKQYSALFTELSNDCYQ